MKPAAAIKDTQTSDRRLLNETLTSALLTNQSPSTGEVNQSGDRSSGVGSENWIRGPAIHQEQSFNNLEPNY